MALGGMGGSVAKKILVSIDVMTKGAQEKLQAFEQQTRRATTAIDKSVTGNMSNAQSQLDQFMGGMRGMGPAAKNAETKTRSLNDRIATFGKDARFASDMANQFRMDMMSVMFAGMQLMATFGGMIRSMFKFTGAADAMGAAMKSVLLPVTMMLQPLLLQLSEFLIGLDKNSKMALGLSVVLLALTGAVAFLGAQIIMLSGALAGATISIFSFELALASIIGLFAALLAGVAVGVMAANIIEKAFGKLAAFLATVIVPALVLVGIALGVITAPAWAIVAVIGVLIGGLIAFSDEIIAVFSSLPKHISNFIKASKDFLIGLWNGFKKWLGKAIDFVMALPGKIWNGLKKTNKKILSFLSTFATTAKKLGKKIVSGIIDFVSKLPNKVWNFITSTVQKLKNALSTVGSAAMDIGSKIINAIASGMKNAPGAIMDAIKSIAPDWVIDVLGKAGSAISGGISTVTDAAGNVINVNDFVMTPNGDVLKTAPDDFIFGTKTPGALAGGGGGNEVTINIDAEVSDEIDMRDLARRVGDEIDRSTGGRSNIGRGGGI